MLRKDAQKMNPSPNFKKHTAETMKPAGYGRGFLWDISNAKPKGYDFAGNQTYLASGEPTNLFGW